MTDTARFRHMSIPLVRRIYPSLVNSQTSVLSRTHDYALIRFLRDGNWVAPASRSKYVSKVNWLKEGF